MKDDLLVHYKKLVLDPYKCNQDLCAMFTSHIPFVDCPACLESIAKDNYDNSVNSSNENALK